MSIQVLRPGLLTTLQDPGRHGMQHLGLCPGGAMDPVALALANALVGNAPDEAALEVTVIGPELQFEFDTLVAVCGAEFKGSFPHNRPVLAPAGSRYNVGRAIRGARAYIAVAGGFDVAPVLHSRSTYLPGKFGGFEGRPLRHGDVLPLNRRAAEWSKERFRKLKNARQGTVRWSAPPLTLPDREPHRPADRRRIAGVEAAGDVRRADEGHHFGVGAHLPRAVAFAHVAVQVDSFHRTIAFPVIYFSYAHSIPRSEDSRFFIMCRRSSAASSRLQRAKCTRAPGAICASRGTSAEAISAMRG